jgi:hypothetical protein
VDRQGAEFEADEKWSLDTYLCSTGKGVFDSFACTSLYGLLTSLILQLLARLFAITPGFELLASWERASERDDDNLEMGSFFFR